MIKKMIPIMVVAVLCLNFGAYGQATSILKGRVVDAQTQEPLGGAIIKIAKPVQTVITNTEGYFELRLPQGSYQLQVQYLAYGAKEIPINMPAKETFIIALTATDNSLNEVQVIGYGQTTKRLSTGSISSINAKDIGSQPVSNILSALSGRMPGVMVQTTNGLPGGNINVQVRGRGSIAAGTDPLYVIDGVPFDGAAPNAANSQIGYNSINGTISPLNSINPADIEQITVLKDADATSIYGSRGSNGVIIITTKAARGLALNFNVNYKNGNSRAAQMPKLMSLPQYLSMRREAFANAGQTPSDNPTSANYAPDLTLWSQTEGTDWADYIFGNTAKMQDLQLALSNAQGAGAFQVNANYHKEGTILLGNDVYERMGMSSNYQFKKAGFGLAFKFQLNHQNADYSNLANSSAFLLAPNYPLTLADGSFNWYGGNNVLAETNARSKNQTLGLISNLALSQQLYPSLSAKLNLGFTNTSYKTLLLYPLMALRPNSINYTRSSVNNNSTVIVEPQLVFKKTNNEHQYDLLLGGTYQAGNRGYQYFQASSYTLEALMEDWAAAAIVDSKNTNQESYRYLSAFGRVGYTYRQRYIFNATLRRDGSSRFGPGHRFGNFWSLAGAWLWHEDNWIKTKLPWLSHGKLRLSMGTTGNDQIGDHQYLSTYTSATGQYQGQGVLRPSRISNDNFRWETTLKKDIALELGALNDKYFLSVNYYQNQTRDQLVSHVLPQLTGFSSYLANLPAKVLNRGWEVVSQINLMQKRSLQGTLSFNFTTAKNKLQSFENLENSTYADLYKIGEDINRINGTLWLGINPATGQAQYADANGQPSNAPYIYYTLGTTSPAYYGGMGTQWAYKGFELSTFAQFVKQKGLGHALFTIPGTGIFNGYRAMESRWSASNGDAIYPTAKINTYDINFPTSSANFFDTSFLRIKSLSLAYNFPAKWLGKLKLKGMRLAAESQNPFTFWNKDLPILDPESGLLNPGLSRNMPPLKTFIFSAQLNF